MKRVLILVCDSVAAGAAISALLLMTGNRGHILIHAPDLLSPAIAMAWYFIAVWFRFWIKFRTYETGGSRNAVVD